MKGCTAIIIKAAAATTYTDVCERREKNENP
jgi:hypothetical protein